MSYEEQLPTRVPWGRAPNALKFFQTVGSRMDFLTQRYREAVQARFAAFAPSDALDYIGADRQLPRGPGEADADYVPRLIRAWELWQGDNAPLTGVGGGAASHLGLLNALAAAGLPTGPDGATIVQQNGRYSQLDGAGGLVLGTLMGCVNRIDLTGVVNPRPGWTFDGRDNFWSVFGLVFPAPVPGFEQATVNGAVAKWRPSKALFIGTWVIEAGATLGWPTGRTLGTDPVLGGNDVTFFPGPGADNVRIGYYAIP